MSNKGDKGVTLSVYIVTGACGGGKQSKSLFNLMERSDGLHMTANTCKSLYEGTVAMGRRRGIFPLLIT